MSRISGGPVDSERGLTRVYPRILPIEDSTNLSTPAVVLEALRDQSPLWGLVSIVSCVGCLCCSLSKPYASFYVHGICIYKGLRIAYKLKYNNLYSAREYGESYQ